MAQQLNVSTMTVLRAIEELEHRGLVISETGGQTGRKKYIKPIEKKKISYENALEESLPKIQLIKYDVSLLSEGQYVDAITMILSLEQMDERIDYF